MSGKAKTKFTLATASIEVDGETKRYIAISGGDYLKDPLKHGDTVTINGTEFEIVDTPNSRLPVEGTSNNNNAIHSEVKLMNHFEDQYQNQNLNIEMAVQNTSLENPGPCKHCAHTIPYFADQNPSFEIDFKWDASGPRKP